MVNSQELKPFKDKIDLSSSTKILEFVDQSPSLSNQFQERFESFAKVVVSKDKKDGGYFLIFTPISSEVIV